MSRLHGISKDPPKKALNISSFLSQVDSDDDDNSFQPPALSNYALDLLEKEQQNKENIIPKRVNFIESKVLESKESNTLYSDPETIFSKNNSYSSPNNKTPLTINNDSRTRSIRRLKMFGSLGPPKRNNSTQSLEDTPMKDASPNKAPTKINFEDLNPYQYAKKYNIPSAELPNLIKLYFDQNKENTNLQSPVKLKNAMFNQIQEEIRQNLTPKKIESKPIELFKQEKIERKPLIQLTENKIIDQNNIYKQPIKEPDYQSMKHLSRIINVNEKQYEKLELLGKGGSSKVFKVKSLKNKVYAIKKIVFDEFDDSSIKGFKGEIDLLIKLRNQERVVRLIDYSLGNGSLLLVMECGDIDLSHVLSKRLDSAMDIEFVRYHSTEMIKCVKAVHDAGIVHSDLKPANFLFVKGMLKIIDFGIANQVPDHTVNIYRESQIGTPNYMAPECLIDNENSTWKVGKPSDIWSCGCIIYQMIYGRPPYGSYQGSQRLLAIMNPEVKIIYPEKGLGGIKVPGTALETIKNCLIRDPNKRWDVNQILNGSFLKPRIVTENFINDLVKNAITYGISKNNIDDDELKNLADDVWRRVSQLSL